MGRGLRACLREVSSDLFHFAKISYSLFHAEFWPDYEDASSNLASILRVSLAFKLPQQGCWAKPGELCTRFRCAGSHFLFPVTGLGGHRSCQRTLARFGKPPLANSLTS